jgi:serine/threonine protein kinase
MKDEVLIGQNIKERYQLQEIIGTGGMGVVFKAYDHQNQQECAVKLLKMSVHKATTHQRFDEEIRLITKLNSPHIVQVYDTGVTIHHRRFVVMELLHGFPLSKILKSESILDAERALYIALGICTALETAHHIGVIHRDLKPANIFVDPTIDGDVIKILDFGIAKDLNREVSLSLTGTGMLVGTPTYMAPESFNDRSNITVTVDLYAVGLLLYRMIVGHIPFYPNHPNLPKAIQNMPIPIQVCWLHLNYVPPLISNIPKYLALFIAELLQKEPNKRPKDATQVIAKIHYILEQHYPKHHSLNETQVLPKDLFANVISKQEITSATDTVDHQDQNKTPINVQIHRNDSLEDSKITKDYPLKQDFTDPQDFTAPQESTNPHKIEEDLTTGQLNLAQPSSTNSRSPRYESIGVISSPSSKKSIRIHGLQSKHHSSSYSNANIKHLEHSSDTDTDTNTDTDTDTHLAKVDTETLALNPQKIRELHAELEALIKQTNPVTGSYISVFNQDPSTTKELLSKRETKSLNNRHNHMIEIKETQVFKSPKLKTKRFYLKRLTLLLCLVIPTVYYLLYGLRSI